MASKKIRPIRVEGNIAYVPLTQGYEAVIDVEDIPLVEGSLWYIFKKRTVLYAVRGIGAGEGARKHRKMHRLILGNPEGMMVDHIDGDGLNNRRSNLRAVTASQNSMNSMLTDRNKSGFRGVSALGDNWVANIQVDGKNFYIGRFRTAELAGAAYFGAAKVLFGSYMRDGQNPT